MDVALVENAEDDIDGEQGRAEQQREGRLRLLEGRSGAGEDARTVDGMRMATVASAISFCASLSACRREVEGDGRGGEQAW